MRVIARLAVVLAVTSTVVSGCTEERREVQDTDPYLAMNRVLLADGCSSCHAADYVRVGPSMIDVAAVYQSASADELAELRLRITEGSSGKWGAPVMPAQPQITYERSVEITNTIMSLNTLENR